MHETHEEDGQEHGHLQERQHAHVAIDERPWEKEDDLNGEDEVHEGYDIEAYVESDPGVAEGFFAALVRGKFASIRTGGTEQTGGEKTGDDENDAEEEKDEDLTELREHRHTNGDVQEVGQRYST
jgi:hypothetical protein